MSETGSLIRLHHHNNFDILQEITDDEGRLYYKGLPIYTQVSEAEHNAIIKKEDGIFVDNIYFLNETQYDVTTRFSLSGDIMYFNGTNTRRIEIARAYSDMEIIVALDILWNQLNIEYPIDDYPTGYLVLLTADNKEFVTANGQEFIPKE